MYLAYYLCAHVKCTTSTLVVASVLSYKGGLIVATAAWSVSTSADTEKINI